MATKAKAANLPEQQAAWLAYHSGEACTDMKGTSSALSARRQVSTNRRLRQQERFSLDALPQHASFHGGVGFRRGPSLFLLLCRSFFNVHRPPSVFSFQSILLPVRLWVATVRPGGVGAAGGVADFGGPLNAALSALSGVTLHLISGGVADGFRGGFQGYADAARRFSWFHQYALR